MKFELNSIISIKIRDDLYSLAQARENHLYEFFSVKKTNDEWTNVDLNTVDSLFCIYVASNKMKDVFLKIKKHATVAPSLKLTPRKMLSADTVMDQKYSDTVDLVNLTDNFSSLDANVIRKNLLPQTDAADLCKYELTGMIGSKKYVTDRLYKYFTEGINWDVQKDFIFKGDLKPLKGINF